MKKSIIIFAIATLGTFMPSFGMLISKISRIPIRRIFAMHTQHRSSQLEPGVPLKSPQRVLEEIDLFWKEFSKKDFTVESFNNPSGYAQDIKKMQMLLEDALLASHFWSRINKDREKPYIDNQISEKLRGNCNFFVSTWNKIRTYFGSGCSPQNHCYPRDHYDTLVGNFHWFVSKWDGVTVEDLLYDAEHAQKSKVNSYKIFHYEIPKRIEAIEEVQDELNEEIFNLHTTYNYHKSKILNDGSKE